MKFRAILFTFLTTVAVPPLGAGQAVALKITPMLSFAPARVYVNAIIESDAANRAIRVEAESPDFFSASEMQLDGDQAPRTTGFSFKDLPMGTYRVTATLFGAGGRIRASAAEQIHVVANGFQ